MANNLVYSTLGELITGEETLSLNGVQFIGNIMFGSNVGYTSAGITEADPEMSFLNGYYHPSATGAAADAAAGDYPQVFLDIEGKQRPFFAKDVGAEEVSGAFTTATTPPIRDADVGNRVGACFISSTGQTISCSGPVWWSAYPVALEQDGIKYVDTGAFLGWIFVSDDWVYIPLINSWAYMPEEFVSLNGSWSYILR